jgi:imidazolonepropionase-like amidohydrolase
VFAIRGAKLFPVTSAVIESGTIVVRDGLIEAVGAEAAVPGDARVIDGTGLSVYPGLIDTGSDLGLAAAADAAPTPRVPGGRPTPAATTAGGNDDGGNMRPFFRAADHLTDGGNRAAAMRNGGITSTLVTPTAGIFAGQSALVNLNDDRATMVVRSPVAMHLRFSGGGFRSYPGSLMGRFAYVRQSLLDARRYAEAWRVYQRHLRALRRPETSQALEALQPVLDRSMPLVVPASTAPEVLRVLRLAEEQDLQVIISGASEAAKVAGALKAQDTPVLLSVKFPEKPAEEDPDDDGESLRELRRRVQAPATAAELHRAGVQLVLWADGLAPRDLLRNTGRAVRAGLPEEVALRALTLEPARLFGAGEQLGSLEKGKIANLVVTDGGLFAERTRIRHVFVDGKRYDPQAGSAPPLTSPRPLREDDDR